MAPCSWTIYVNLRLIKCVRVYVSVCSKCILKMPIRQRIRIKALSRMPGHQIKSTCNTAKFQQRTRSEPLKYVLRLLL